MDGVVEVGLDERAVLHGDVVDVAASQIGRVHSARHKNAAAEDGPTQPRVAEVDVRKDTV